MDKRPSPRTPFGAFALALAMTPPCMAQVSFTEFTVDSSSHGNASLWAFDLDNDGLMEILGAAIEDDAVVYWKNQNHDPGNWSKHTIGGNFRGARSVHAADIDGDGDLDVIGASYEGAEVAWWSNEGSSPIEWTRHTIDGVYGSPHEVFASDVDSDGDIDVLCASSSHHRVTLWRNDGGEPLTWTEQTVAAGVGMAKSVCTGDLDSDGREDVIGAALYDDEVLWWRNRGGDPIEWEEHVVDAEFGGAHRVQAIDVDGDLDLDIVGAGYTGHVVAWWRNDGGDPIVWTKQVISFPVFNACVAQAADIDGDGILDVTASAQLSGQLSWWHNDGGDPISWTESQVATLRRVWPLFVVDLDNDGDNDIIAGSSHNGSNEVKWYRNDRFSVRFRRPSGRLIP